MTPAEEMAIQEAVAKGVAKGIQDSLSDHSSHCRFSAEEARMVHQLYEDLDHDSIYLLGRMGKWMDGAASWIGRAVVIVLLVAIAWGIDHAIRMGWIKP